MTFSHFTERLLLPLLWRPTTGSKIEQSCKQGTHQDLWFWIQKQPWWPSHLSHSGDLRMKNTDPSPIANLRTLLESQVPWNENTWKESCTSWLTYWAVEARNFPTLEVFAFFLFSPTAVFSRTTTSCQCLCLSPYYLRKPQTT